MVIQKVRVHTCEKVKQGVLKPEGFIEGKCRCRKFVSIPKAQQMIDDGIARHVITDYDFTEVDINCSMCGERPDRHCAMCAGRGTVKEYKLVTQTSEEIYIRPTLKTPRTATIESKHLNYAFDSHELKKPKHNRAIDRIEEYRDLDKQMLLSLGAALVNSVTREILVDGRPEPEDDPKKGTGRRYDYGRSI